MTRKQHLLLASIALGAFVLTVRPLAAATLKLSLPLGRTAYQTNEQIDLCVVRSDAKALGAANLNLVLASSDGSRIALVFPVAPCAGGAKGAAASEHLHLSGWLLRPGHYKITVAAYDATASTEIDVFSHVRRSTFKTLDWGCPVNGPDMAIVGEDGMGFNLLYGNYRLGINAANAEATLRGGADYMQCCTMGGAHQMDLRSECDWSDPYVINGGAVRVAQQAFMDRTKPNAIGVHYYDEPGLTWERGSPHLVTAQLRSFKSAFGADRIAHTAVQPGDAAAMAKWQFWGRWKESFMEAAWKIARFNVNQVKPDLISVTQSQYAWYAFSEGYYFNVARALPVVSGHGGYDDGPASYFYPAYFHEFGRIREFDKPVWYLPNWCNNTQDELYRLEQYLCFMTDLQGLAKSPGPAMNAPYAAASSPSVVETNKMGLRLGSVFTTMRPNCGEVALLHSLSQCLDAQIQSGMKDHSEGGGETRGRLLTVYMASKMIHVPFTPVVEEDVLDGSLAGNYKAIVLTNNNYLDPRVVAVLEDYAAGGGLVLMTDDCRTQIKGAKRVGAAAPDLTAAIVEAWMAGKQKESVQMRAAGLFFRAVKPLADALKAKLADGGIRPIVDCDNQQMVFSRHSQADVEYLFAVNAAADEKVADPLAIKPTAATIGFAADGRPIYDAVRGGAAAELKAKLTNGLFRFGAGEMRVFARTARPIGGVQVQTPIVARDFVREAAPICVSIDAALTDAAGGKLAGAVPMQIRVVDPLGGVRYDLYRATTMGSVALSLPLAANDPPGQWTVIVKELLDNHVGSARFTYRPATQCGSLAGATQRAVFFGNDRENIFRFIRTHRDITIVKGAADYCAAAAERLAEVLKPWGVRATIVAASAVSKPRRLTADEAKTWIGLELGRAVAGDANRPALVGFALNGPAILLGAPADNPLIATVSSLGFLPYAPSADFPGRGAATSLGSGTPSAWSRNR